MTPIIIDRIQAFAVSATPPRGPESSLGSMPVRNGLLLCLTTLDGVEGWGEVWCNFPPRGNISRLFLFEDVIAPRLVGRTFPDWTAARPALEAELGRMARHTGEVGAFNQCFAGIDTALADIAARQAGKPLSRLLDADAAADVAVYASTPDVSRLEASVEDMVCHGHTAAKLKIGFGLDTDVALLDRFRAIADGRLAVMADANQNWSLDEAKGAMRAVADYDLRFVEEPLASDAPKTDWADLAASSPLPIAAGENITSEQSFREFASLGRVRVLQPDVAKWGGVSGALAVGRDALDAGVTCAMHYMGTGLGLAASAHVMAATGCDGPVELDANPNPLRTDLGDIDLNVRDGRMAVPEGNGIGFVPDPSALAAMSVASIDIH